jgi:hypothetical protein
VVGGGTVYGIVLWRCIVRLISRPQQICCLKIKILLRKNVCFAKNFAMGFRYFRYQYFATLLLRINNLVIFG